MKLKTLALLVGLSLTQITGYNTPELESKLLEANKQEILGDAKETFFAANEKKYPKSKAHYTNDEISNLKIKHQSVLKDNSVLIMYSDEGTNTAQFKKAKLKQVKESNNYDSLVKRIEHDRLSFQKIYNSATSDKERKDAIINAREYLEGTMLQEIFPTWLGTTWDFYGTTTQPLKGKVACGYFLSTTLNAAGVRVSNRIAAHPSENIIKFISGKNYVVLSNNKGLDKVNAKLEEKFNDNADGLYIIGLDCHTGFLYKQGNKIDFIHSTYINPWSVVWENGFESGPITSSGYKVVGKVFTDNVVMKWLEGSQISVPKWESKR